MTEEIQNRNK